jgi:hypothetical protein
MSAIADRDERLPLHSLADSPPAVGGRRVDAARPGRSESTDSHPRDRDIRRRLLERLRAVDGSRVVEELTLLRGQIRADVALISSDLAGFEIKSKYDSLERLPKQRAIYGRIFDKITLVTSPHHLKRARRMIPQWWGIWLVQASHDAIDIVELRQAGENPRVDIEALLQLFWKDEIIAFLRLRGVERGVENKNRRDLCRRLADEVPHVELKRAVIDALRLRNNWRT